jgi:glyoxylase-like metal-dependent hydrolase (beta-lactamase superfamily II)
MTGLSTLSVGLYAVHVLVDGTYEAPIEDLIHVEDPELRTKAIARWGKPTFAVDVNCFALHGPEGLILIDAGAGEHWGPAYGKATLALHDAGFTPERVGAVLLTHIHGDHALGLLAGEKARFPNADIHVPQGDLAYYGDPANIERTPSGVRGGFKNLELVRQAYGPRVQPVGTGAVLAGIDAMALPGHTPGHTGYLIHGDRKNLLVSGDVVHLDALQLADPRLGFGYDLDIDSAFHSRNAALKTATREGWYVAGGHLRGIRRLVRSGDGFAYAQENHG